MDSVHHINDMIIAQRKLLWWAKPAERTRIIEETRADMIFQIELDEVALEMGRWES